MDIECEARLLRQQAGYGEDDVTGGIALAKRLGIPVRRVDGGLLRGGDGCIIWLHGEPEICVRRGLTPERLQWVVAHEIGEWRIHEVDYRGEDAEHLAHAMAAAILMPRSAFREAAFERREDLGELAQDFGCTQTAAALRLAEASVASVVVVVCPARIYARAPEDFALPGEPALRRGALSGQPGVRSVRLSDARRRVAYVAA